MYRKSLMAMCGLVAVTLTLRGCGNALVPTAGRGLPEIVDAKALSNHYVEVTFITPPGEEAADPGAYSITEGDGTVLPVEAARISHGDAKVILTTAPQREVEYRLSVGGNADAGEAGGGVAGPGGGIVTFTGSVTSEPYLASAISLGPTSVLLTFSGRMDNNVEVAEFYRIAAPDLEITDAVQSDEETTAVLTTETQENVEYTVKVTNVTTQNGSTLIDPTRCTAAFYGIPPDDTTPPTLRGAVCANATSVLLSFSEPLDEDADDPMNFSIDPDPVIIGAELTTYATQVLLVTLPLTAEVQYTVTVTNTNGQMRDLSRNALDPAGCPNNLGVEDPTNICSATFTFPGQPSIEDASTLPRVVAAHSMDNKHVIVIFSKAMGDSAIDPGNYMIVQTNLVPEAAVLTVLQGQFLGLDRTAVKLTTLSQATVQYDLFAVGVKDQAGNQLAPKGVLVDPTYATFWGTGPIGAPEDQDGDGLPDNEEQRGWVVPVVLIAGENTMRDVTSDPTVPDTDGDGLNDAQEKRRLSDPRDPDTDDDLIDDYLEVTRLHSSPTHQDSDQDGIDDFKEVDVFQTSPILADTDGDGFDDAREVFELNRNPRIADLPKLQITVGDMALRIDERFTDQVTRAVVSESSSSTTLARSEQTQFGHSDTNVTQHFKEYGAEWGASLAWKGKLVPEVTVHGGGSYKTGDSRNHSVQTTAQSAQESQQVYQSSLSKAEQYAASVTREVVGASIDSYLVVENVGDVAFTVSDLEISAMLPGRLRDRFVPIATMLPAGELISGNEAVYNLAPFAQKGPIIISNREIYPSLVEDLMRNPRGLIFEVANYDIIDEFGRNLAFQTEEVLGRTITLTIDPGDGTFQRYAVATNGAYGGRCAADSVNAGAICRDDDDCICPPPARSGLTIADECNLGACEPVFFGGFDEHGTAIPLPLDFVMRDVLGLRKNQSEPDAIVAGVNGRADTVAVGDDIQVVSIGTDGLNDRTIVVLAGEDGVLDTPPNNVCVEPPECASDPEVCCDDVEAKTTGYHTSPTCNADTAASINEPEFDGDGIASTEADGDDVQQVPVGEPAAPGQVVVSAGPNGILETVVAGDDEYRGPGESCDPENDCGGGFACGENQTCQGGPRDGQPCDCPDEPGSDQGQAACNGREVLVRFENSKTGDPNRFWVVLTSEEICYDEPAACEIGIPAGSDFGDIPLRPTQAVTLAFGQDIDRDGLFAREEFIYGSSDQKKDTDDDTLHDFAEIREGWEVDVVGKSPEPVYPDPRFEDSDFDGLEDPVEQNCLTDPTRRDTDGDGLFDVVELGITTDFNGNGEIDDFERGFGRCCEDADGSECLGEERGRCVNGLPCTTDGDCDEGFCDLDFAPVPCRMGSDDDCREEEHFEVCAPYALGECCDEEGECDPLASCWRDDECPTDYPDCTNYDLSGICPPPDNPPDPPVRLDPRNPDTDGDSVEDADELELGLNPLDPDDAAAYRDADQDGLYDVDEQGGWDVTLRLCSNICGTAFDGTCDDEGGGCDLGTDCGDCGHRMHPETVFSNPLEGDTDFDGLPDYLEHVLGTNPQNDDTDCDGLLDYDEFAEFGAYMNLTYEYPGFYLSGSNSQQLGTDPTSQDTDNDLLPDFFELTDGWRVLAYTDDAPREVYSDPMFYDTDLDGLSDLDEYLGSNGLPPSVQGICADGTPNGGQACNEHADCGAEPGVCDQGTCRGGPKDGELCTIDADCYSCVPAPNDATDPTDADTDGDGRLDGPEYAVDTDPLRPDLLVKVTFVALVIYGANAPGAWWQCGDYDCDEGGCWSHLAVEGAYDDCEYNRENYCHPDLWDYFSNDPEFRWFFYVRGPGYTGQDGRHPPGFHFPGTLISDQCAWARDNPDLAINTACQSVALPVGCAAPINESATFTLLPGQSFQLFLEVSELNYCDECAVWCDDSGYELKPVGRIFQWGPMIAQKTYRFEEVLSGGATTLDEDFALQGGGASEVHVFVEIEIQ